MAEEPKLYIDPTKEGAERHPLHINLINEYRRNRISADITVGFLTAIGTTMIYLWLQFPQEITNIAGALIDRIDIPLSH